MEIAQRFHGWDWVLEIAQPAVLDVPSDAVSPVTAQGQLGLGGTYYPSNDNTEPASAFLKQGFVGIDGENSHILLGRSELFEGHETHSANSTFGWLQSHNAPSDW